MTNDSADAAAMQVVDDRLDELDDPDALYSTAEVAAALGIDLDEDE